MSSKKPFFKMDREELNNEIDKKTAYPDMALKRQYFQAEENMTLAEGKMMDSYYKNGKQYGELDIIRFRSTILMCFRPISGMIKDAKVWNLPEEETPLILKKNGVKTDFDLCMKLTHYAPLDVTTLIHLAGYIHHALCELGLTNLLLDTGNKEFDIRDVI